MYPSPHGPRASKSQVDRVLVALTRSCSFQYTTLRLFLTDDPTSQVVQLVVAIVLSLVSVVGVVQGQKYLSTKLKQQ